MKTRNGGQEAKAGFWWNTKSWEITLVKATGNTLPGGPEVRYLRVPTLALVVLGPAMGALFVMFLPLLGFAMLFGALATKVGTLVAETGRAMADATHARHSRPATPQGVPEPKHREGSVAPKDEPAPRS
jgi:hypothetical protein